MYQIESPPNLSSRDHILRFIGCDPSCAARRVGKLLASLRLGAGKFLELSTLANDDLPSTRIYANPDKNSRQMKVESAFRKIKPLLTPHLSKPVYFEHATATVSSEWKSLVKFQVVGDKVELVWAPGNVELFHLPTEDITKDFHEAMKAVQRVSTWV